MFKIEVLSPRESDGADIESYFYVNISTLEESICVMKKFLRENYGTQKIAKKLNVSVDKFMEEYVSIMSVTYESDETIINEKTDHGVIITKCDKCEHISSIG